LRRILSGVNFINVILAVFTPADPKIVKIQLSHQYLFTLLGSAGVKALRRTLMKLTPGQDTLPKIQMNIFVSKKKLGSKNLKY